MSELAVTSRAARHEALPEFRPAAALSQWILTEGPRFHDVGAFLAALGPRLDEAGIPVARMTSGIPLLHPVVRAESALWVEGQEVVLRRYPAALETDQALAASPLHAVYYKGETVRVPVTAAPVKGEFPIVEELRRDGFTDYIAFPVPSGEQYNSATVATRREGGFTEAMVDDIEALLPAIGLVFELLTQRRTAETLLDTYVGKRTARRVLSGEIRRGDGQSIKAVIYFADLRGFTELTARYSAQEVVAILNFYFESVTEPATANGGEILKFIGDAVLAIFPYDDHAGACDASERALDAARQAQINLGKFCTTCHADRMARLEVGVSLHAGEVFYGNVGGRDRLDFTVVGEAVNVGSRLSGLSRDLGHPVLVSKSVVELACRSFASAGEHRLKGVAEPQHVFYPVECEQAIAAAAAE